MERELNRKGNEGYLLDMMQDDWLDSATRAAKRYARQQINGYGFISTDGDADWPAAQKDDVVKFRVQVRNGTISLWSADVSADSTDTSWKYGGKFTDANLNTTDTVELYATGVELTVNSFRVYKFSGDMTLVSSEVSPLEGENFDIKFSTALNRAPEKEDFTLKDSEGNVVANAIGSISGSGVQYTLTLGTNLEYSENYTLSVSNTLTTTQGFNFSELSFTTAEEPADDGPTGDDSTTPNGDWIDLGDMVADYEVTTPTNIFGPTVLETEKKYGDFIMEFEVVMPEGGARIKPRKGNEGYLLDMMQSDWLDADIRAAKQYARQQINGYSFLSTDGDADWPAAQKDDVLKFRVQVRNGTISLWSADVSADSTDTGWKYGGKFTDANLNTTDTVELYATNVEVTVNSFKVYRLSGDMTLAISKVSPKKGKSFDIRFSSSLSRTPEISDFVVKDSEGSVVTNAIGNVSGSGIQYVLSLGTWLEYGKEYTLSVSDTLTTTQGFSISEVKFSTSQEPEYKATVVGLQGSGDMTATIERNFDESLNATVLLGVYQVSANGVNKCLAVYSRQIVESIEETNDIHFEEVVEGDVYRVFVLSDLNSLHSLAKSFSTGIVQFHEDFSSGLAYWNINKNQFITEGERNVLISDNSGLCTATISGETTLWGEAVYEFDVLFLENSSGLFQVRLRENSEEYFSLLMRPLSTSGFRYMYKNKSGSSTEKTFGQKDADMAISQNEKYHIKIVNKNDSTKVYAKTANTEYVLVGETNIRFEGQGTFSITSFGAYCEVSDIKIYNLNPGEFYFKNKIQKGKVGTSQTNEIVNNTGIYSNIIYTSSDTGVATVGANGEVAFHGEGTAVITAELEQDGKKYIASYDIISTGNLNVFGFNCTERTMYVGEVLNLCAVIRSDSVENKRIRWTVDNDEVVEIVGKMHDEKSIIAKKAGETKITIQSVDDPSFVREVTICVLDLPSECEQVSFECSDFVRQIPDNYYGMHSNPLSSISDNKEEMIEKEKGRAEIYSDLNLDFIRFMLNDFDWKNGKYPSAGENVPSYSLEDIYTASEEANIPYVISVGDNDTADSIVEMVSQINSITDRPIYLEMGNESWHINHANEFPTINDFAQRVVDVYHRIKAINDEIKISVPIFEIDACEEAKNKIEAGESVTEQAKRLAYWNDGLIEISDYFDAVVIHRYSEIDSWAQISTFDIMDTFYKKSLSDSKDLKDVEQAFAGKEIWITEFGDLPKIFSFTSSKGYYNLNDDKYFNVQSESERARLQYTKSVGNAVGYANRLLKFLDNESVTMASYHYFDDSQGFGLIQDGITLPNFYLFDKMGEILDENSHYYKIDVNTDEQIDMYGLGNDVEMKQLVVSNLTKSKVEIDLSGYTLSNVWTYGGSNPLPDFGTYDMAQYTALPSVIPEPIEYVMNSDGKVYVEPYSITVIDL